MNIGDIADLFNHVDANLKNTAYFILYVFTLRFLIETIEVFERFLTTTVAGSLVLATVNFGWTKGIVASWEFLSNVMKTVMSFCCSVYERMLLAGDIKKVMLCLVPARFKSSGTAPAGAVPAPTDPAGTVLAETATTDIEMTELPRPVSARDQ